MNIGRSRLAAIMTFVVSCLAFYASLEGLLNKNLYQEVLSAGTISKSLMAGSLAQDIISIPLSVILALLSLAFIKQPGYKKLITILGLTGYFFYAYGLYVIQGQYTSIYLVYMAIFGVSIYSLILGFLSFDPSTVKTYQLPSILRWSITIFLLLILSILTPGWLLRIYPAIANHVPEGAYAVFILDLCIVFPAMGLTVVQLLRRKSFGIVLAGVVLIKAFTVCLSWGFAEWFVQFYGFRTNYSMLAISGTLTLISLLLTALYIFNLKTEPNRLKPVSND